MLWFKLLQNTIYCGKLHFTFYQPYQWGGYITIKHINGGKRRTLKKGYLCSLKYLAATTLTRQNIQPANQKEEG
jgi:hypothetical protein